MFSPCAQKFEYINCDITQLSTMHRRSTTIMLLVITEVLGKLLISQSRTKCKQVAVINSRFQFDS